MNYKVNLYPLLTVRIILLINKYLIIIDIAESDLIYTETLMQRGKENYENKEIVILGKILEKFPTILMKIRLD